MNSFIRHYLSSKLNISTAGKHLSLGGRGRARPPRCAGPAMRSLNESAARLNNDETLTTQSPAAAIPPCNNKRSSARWRRHAQLSRYYPFSPFLFSPFRASINQSTFQRQPRHLRGHNGGLDYTMMMMMMMSLSLLARLPFKCNAKKAAPNNNNNFDLISSLYNKRRASLTIYLCLIACPPCNRHVTMCIYIFQSKRTDGLFLDCA